IVLLGFTKAGKSSLLARLTNAKPLIADYPYATREPEVGMLPYEDIQFQLVEAPSFRPEAESHWNLKPLALARNADSLALVVDLTVSPESQLTSILEILEAAKISVKRPRGRVVIDFKTMVPGVQLVGAVVDATVEDVRRLLASYGVRRALVKVYGEATLDDVEDALFEGLVYRPALVLANKADLVGQAEAEGFLEHCRGLGLPTLAVSALTGQGLNALGSALYQNLNLIRVYTKPPGADKPSPQPFTLKEGATILDLAQRIHRSLAEKFRYAKVWPRNSSTPIRVGGDYRLQDGDVVEIRGG
ncbi:MAG: TGS domain-containing protein, partial [Candidatus Hecatellaceae archaeon]